MLFRDFNMIAAVAYAAQRAATTQYDAKPKPCMLWDELSEGEQNQHMQSALDVARGEPTIEGVVFEATAKAIFDYNGGQGLLALEDLMNLGSTVMSLELLTEAEVADTNIRESIVPLLHELAERRQGAELGLGATAMPGPGYTDTDLRSEALAIAADRHRRVEGEAAPESLVEAAQVFYDFIASGSDAPWVRTNALNHAVQLTSPGGRASTTVLVAQDLMTFLEPAPALLDRTKGTEKPAEPQVEAVH